MSARGKASTMPGMVANVVAKEVAIVVMAAAGTLTAEKPKFSSQSLAVDYWDKNPFHFLFS